jgi:hypothetical protein
LILLSWRVVLVDLFEVGMVAATARQRWLVGMENQIIELGIDEFLGCMEKAEGISFGFLVWF